MVSGAQVTAWRPPIAGLREVLHARFVDHAYPMHTHDCWTLLVVDEGAVRYELDRHEHGAERPLVTVLPPGVPHNGRSVRPEGFRKRVIYLEPEMVGEDLVGTAVSRPGLADPLLRRRVDQLHGALALRTEDLEAASRFWLIRDRLLDRLRPAEAAHRRPHVSRTARTEPRAAALRELLDSRVPTGLTLDEAARLLDTHPTYLVRAFGRAYGLPPHAYLISRRLDLARRHLLDGVPVADAAVRAGFYDQSHLTRHFRRVLGVNPGAYARGGKVRSAAGPSQPLSGP